LVVKVFASYNILQNLCDFIYVLMFVNVSKCRKRSKLTNHILFVFSYKPYLLMLHHHLEWCEYIQSWCDSLSNLLIPIPIQLSHKPYLEMRWAHNICSAPQSATDGIPKQCVFMLWDFVERHQSGIEVIKNRIEEDLNFDSVWFYEACDARMLKK
jgi:hypothetical protein